MSSSANDEDKYTLDYFPHGGRDVGGDGGGDAEPPFKYRTFYLDDAVAEAWRISRGGGSALRISRHGEITFDEGRLRELLDKMSGLEAGQSGLDERELAVRAIGEPDEAEPVSEDAESVSGEAESASGEPGEADAGSNEAKSAAGETESPS